MTVRSTRPTAEVGVQVRDQGEGMDVEVLRRVFERFYRGESAAGVPGSGLGMSIVKEIMDIHGGRIGIVQPSPGTGTDRDIMASARRPRAVDAPGVPLYDARPRQILWWLASVPPRRSAVNPARPGREQR